MEDVNQAVKGLVEPGVFALLAVLTADGEVVLRPVGGKWDAGIRDAVREMAEKYPGCKMRLFEQNCDWKRYFEGIVSREQVFPYAAYSAETKAALEEVRRRVFGPPRQDSG